jgi:hypothetical protein
MKKLFTTLMLFVVVSSYMFAQSTTSIAIFNTATDYSLPDSVRPWAKDQGLRGIYVGNDLTANGKQEVLATDYSNGGRVHVFEVNGSVLERIWSSPSNPTAGNPNSVPRWIRTGDLDGDGNMEIIHPYGARYGGQILVWEWDPSAQSFGTEPAIVLPFDAFTSQGVLRVRTDREAAGCWDMDGDGKSELIVANEDGKVYILGVDGDFPGFASWQIEGGDPATTPENKFSPGSYWDSVPADIDGDGTKEIVNHYWNFYGFWSIKPLGANSYKYPTPTADLRKDHYAEYTKYLGEDATAYMGVFPTDVDGNGKQELFGVTYVGTSAINYYAFLVSPQPYTDGVYGWVASQHQDSITSGFVGEKLWELAGKTGGSHWGAGAYDFNGNGKSELLLGGSAGYNLIGLEYKGTGSIYDKANYNASIWYEGDAAVFHNVDIYDSLGVLDTVKYESPFISRLYAGCDLNNDGVKEIVLGYQSVADSITYKRYEWDTLTVAFIPVQTWKIRNPTAINLRVLEYHPTGVKPLDLTVVNPEDYQLSQNYPNPFNPSTKINFTLPMNKNITMKVYDILGNEIKTLVNGDVAKGSYEVTWDGTNNFNQPVASGTYITVLKYGNFTKSIKMSLVK